MEKMKNSELDISSRKRRHSLLEQTDSPPNTELPKVVSVYFEPQMVFEARDMSNLLGVQRFSHPLVLTVKVTTDQFPEGQFQTFNIDDQEARAHRFDLNASVIGEFKVTLCDFRAVLNGDILTEMAYDLRFNDAGRPHDVVLNFGNEKLYCHKVVLAMLSDYFDRLFFGENAEPIKKSYDLPDLKADAVAAILNCCLTEDWIDPSRVAESGVRGIQALFFLEVSTFMKNVYDPITNLPLYVLSNNEERPEKFANVMIGLELEEKYGLKHLDVQAFFRKYFSAEERQLFLHEYADRLNKLSWKTKYHFMNEALSAEDRNLYNLSDGKSKQVVVDERNVDKLKNVTLLVGGQEFRVHKEYLAFWSPYFETLFFGGYTEAGKTEVELKDVDPLEFDVLLNKLYSPRKIEVDDSNVTFLLKLANRFGMKSIMIMCGRYLDRQIGERAFSANDRGVLPLIDLLELSDTYNFIDVQNYFLLDIRRKEDNETRNFREENCSRLLNMSDRMVKNIIQSI